VSEIILPVLHGVYEKIYLTSSRGLSDDVTSGSFVSTGLPFRFTKRAQFLIFSIYYKSTFLPASVDIKLNKIKMGNQD
jgi:hypothetical protein